MRNFQFYREGAGCEERRDVLQLVISRDGRDGSLTVSQDIDLFPSVLSAGGEVRHPLREGRGAWVQVVRGRVQVNGTKLKAGGGAAIEDESELVLAADDPSDVLLFDRRI